jgi:hypothetical protein
MSSWCPVLRSCGMRRASKLPIHSEATWNRTRAVRTSPAHHEFATGARTADAGVPHRRSRKSFDRQKLTQQVRRVTWAGEMRGGQRPGAWAHRRCGSRPCRTKPRLTKNYEPSDVHCPVSAQFESLRETPSRYEQLDTDAVGQQLHPPWIASGTIEASRS